MVNVKKAVFGGFSCNSYIVTADNKNAVVIDCNDPRLYSKCIDLGLTPVAVLLTHGHFDHVGGCGEFYKRGIPVYCGENEKSFIFSAENRGIFGGVPIPDFKIYKTLSDGEILNICGMKIRVISTPGHTVGGVCYAVENCLFTGDTLFRCGIGRTDLAGGDFKTLINSVKKLFALDGDYNVYCGHERDTTLQYERENNPYIC